MITNEYKTIDVFPVLTICFFSLITYGISIFVVFSFKLYYLLFLIAFGLIESYVVYLAGSFLLNRNNQIRQKTFLSIVFVGIIVLPLSLALLFNAVFTQNNKAYFSYAPGKDYIQLKVNISDEVTKRGNIGNDIGYEYSINGIHVANGDIIYLKKDQFLKITSEIIEYDDGYSDKGESNSIVKLSLGNNNSVTFSQNVSVKENGGKYSGEIRKYKVRFTFSKDYSRDKLIPNYSHSDTKVLRVLFVIFVGLYVLLFFFAFLGYKEKKKYEEQLIKEKAEEREREKQELLIKLEQTRKKEEEQRKILEEQKEKDKQIILNRIDGRSIREAAGVPQNVRFERIGYLELPIDNNDEPYGSFTVYISESGKCFHRKRGCCSASTPYNIVQIPGQYKPCSKCAIGVQRIPQWYAEYIRLKAQCEKYGIEVDL